LSLVIGASGQVGRCLLKRLQRNGKTAAGTYARHAAPGLRHLDISNRPQVTAIFEALKPRVVYLPAALTHVDYCEDHPDAARRINIGGPRTIAEVARGRGTKLVFYSSEYIFDGGAGPYGEEAASAPLSVYGHSKLEAEIAVADILPEALIIRTSVVFGWDRSSKNFAMQIHERVQRGADITVAADQLGTPTLAEYLAEASERLVEKDIGGIVNVAGADTVDRASFARSLVRVFGGEPERVNAVSTASLRQKAARPLRAGLRTDKLRQLLGEAPLSLDNSLLRLTAAWRSNT
jgi:dTDP-4-dehydrorhamnose reductase